MKSRIASLVYSLLAFFLVVLFLVILITISYPYPQIVKGIGEGELPLSLILLVGVFILLTYWAVLPQKDSHQLDILDSPWLKLLLAIILGWLLIINLSLHLETWIAGIIVLVLFILYFALLEALRKV
jgi:hypothetical protein